MNFILRYVKIRKIGFFKIFLRQSLIDREIFVTQYVLATEPKNYLLFSFYIRSLDFKIIVIVSRPNFESPEGHNSIRVYRIKNFLWHQKSCIPFFLYVSGLITSFSFFSFFFSFFRFIFVKPREIYIFSASKSSFR